MLIRLLLLSTLLCQLILPACADDPRRYVAGSTPPAGIGLEISEPVSTSVVTKSWVRLVGQAEDDGRIVLRWQANPARAVQSFRIERSDDGTTWDQLGEVNSANLTKQDYEFTDGSPLRTSVYRLQCQNGSSSDCCSAVLAVVNPRRASQPVRYFTTYERTILIGIDATNLALPVTANLYAETGDLLCYDQLLKKADELRIDVPVKAMSVKLQLVDAAHRVLAVRQIVMP